MLAMPAARHRHHEPIGIDLARAAQVTLERSGEQWTPMRADIFGVLAAAERPVSAYDIAEAVGRARDRRVAANSVYRILDLFVATNLAQRVESENAYVVNAHPECQHDCIFLICDRCHRTAHLDDDTVTGGVRRAAEAAGFAPARPVVEVRGTCSACAAAG